MSRRKPLVLEEAESPVAISGSWNLYVMPCCSKPIESFSGPDGSIQPFVRNILADSNQMDDRVSASAIDPRDIEVEVDVCLGRGACGMVSRGIHKPTGTFLAIKSVQLEEKSKRDQLMNDIRALIAAQDCSYLVQLYSAYFHQKSGRVHVALELMNLGSLQDVLYSLGDSRVPERLIAVILYQVVSGLVFLHRHKYVHRDLKPGNVLLNTAGDVKLSDFGISRTIDNTANICATFVGTAMYMSPERAVGHDYSFSADIWSLGILLYELCTGVFPFPKTSSFPILFDYLCHQPEPRLDPNRFSVELQNFAAVCLQRDPGHRPSASDLLTHPFLVGANSIDRKNEWIHWLARNPKLVPK